MNPVKINFSPTFFGDRPIVMAESGSLKATAFRFSTDVCGLKIENESCSMVILPYHGHQIWFAKFGGKNLTMKSVFDEPLKTEKFGDNYGAFLIHCGLSAMGNPGPEDTHPLHGELPTALFTNNYVKIADDEQGEYISVGGSFNYRNSQEFNYFYKPEIRLYRDSNMVSLHAEIENLRCKTMQYMCMYHINWLAVEGSKILGTVPNDRKHKIVDIADGSDDSPRAQAIFEFSKRLHENPEIGDTLDSKTQTYDPELCTDMRFIGDENNWAHALQIMPEGDACYVKWRRDELPNGLRWVCRTGDEDGIGIALPNTGNHKGYTYAKKHNLLREIPAGGKISMRIDFGYLNAEETKTISQHINKVLGGRS